MGGQIANDFTPKHVFATKYLRKNHSLFGGGAGLDGSRRSARLFFAKPSKTIYVKNSLKNALTGLGSVAVGLVSGFFGGGGGMLCVPLLRANGLEAKKAHATALLVILPLCVVSATIYIRNGYFDGNAVLCACIGVVFGSIVGALVLDRLSGTAVSVIFSLLMIAIGIKSVIL